MIQARQERIDQIALLKKEGKEVPEELHEKEDAPPNNFFLPLKRSWNIQRAEAEKKQKLELEKQYFEDPHIIEALRIKAEDEREDTESSEYNSEEELKKIEA